MKVIDRSKAGEVTFVTHDIELMLRISPAEERNEQIVTKVAGEIGVQQDAMTHFTQISHFEGKRKC